MIVTTSQHNGMSKESNILSVWLPFPSLATGPHTAGSEGTRHCQSFCHMTVTGSVVEQATNKDITKQTST